MTLDVRTGFGLDVHAFGGDGPVVLGGVAIPHTEGLVGHSDADAVAHAVIDALLGAAGMGDIGEHFPDSDSQYAGADSMGLLKVIGRQVVSDGWVISSVDVTVAAQVPRLDDSKARMRERLARVLLIDVDRVNVKATTTERLGFLGRGEGIAAMAVATVVRAEQ